MMDKPTYLRAAIEDWKADRISLEKLCELWHVSVYALGALNLERDAWRTTAGMKRIEEMLEGLR